jgi:hypothetical protein
LASLPSRLGDGENGLSLKDVAEAGGWKDTTTLLKCYAQADPETLAAVVMHDAPARAAR